MSTTAVIAIAIGVVVVLAAISFFTLARRSDVRGAGALSGETVSRDRAARKNAEPIVDAPTAADVEAAGVAARSTEVAVRVEPTLVEWTPPDPEAIGVSRRQFFNRASITLMGVGLGAVRGRSVRCLPVAERHGWVRWRGRRRQDRQHQGRHQGRQRLLLRPRGTFVDHRVPERGAPAGRVGLSGVDPRDDASRV